jgi:asparagine synthase (glutamine-hydrolysing)
VTSAYQAMRGVFTARETERLLPMFGVHGSNGAKPHSAPLPTQPTVEDEISYLELTRYMRNQLLRDSDVMSMAWSLELRVPFVDRKLIDTISQIPARWRLAKGKRLLVDAVPEIPEWVRSRPKQGFTFPFKDWVTTEWKGVFERIEKQSPVPLQNWYRTWCLFALEKFIQKLTAEN